MRREIHGTVTNIDIAPDMRSATIEGICECGARIRSRIVYPAGSIEMEHGDGEARRTFSREEVRARGKGKGVVAMLFQEWVATVHEYERS